MKKFLTHLTGIVFVITILVAGACLNSCKEKVTPAQKVIPAEDDASPASLVKDPTKVYVYLKDTLMGCKTHLEMFNEKHPDGRGKKVIDSLYTDVYPGYTVTWMNAEKAKLKIHHVRLIDSVLWDPENPCIAAIIDDAVRSTFKLKIPSTADTGTLKYEIIFEDEDKQYWCIDPYLKIRR